MAEVHILNVGQGDCSIIKSGSGHLTVIDICGGNAEIGANLLARLLEKAAVRGNFQMCNSPTQPVYYLKNVLQVGHVFRFILTHPDMDHLDGFNGLCSQVTVSNFWDSGVRKSKPDFEGSPYREEDWDKYVAVRDGKTSITVVSPRSGSINKYYNHDDKGPGGDYLYIYSPTEELVRETNESDDDDAVNDASYVVVYRNQGGRVLFPGDAHDSTWEHVAQSFGQELFESEVMLAPHHGRDSGRDWSFLDIIKPQFSILGCASSKHLAYDAWNNRGLDKITQNQAGNIVVYGREDNLAIYIENENFAKASGCDLNIKDSYGNIYYKSIGKSSHYK